MPSAYAIRQDALAEIQSLSQAHSMMSSSMQLSMSIKHRFDAVSCAFAAFTKTTSIFSRSMAFTSESSCLFYTKTTTTE